eukprot:TRINITY_DN21016_c0_g1_i1.p2 TRINITY_DN21016_c0_g1~~TRINITY_DN21016_c0_g1_i1.p2  ORF type:complete len:110 (+),score=4.66 TRINITY_DN21016_c0_g1_i1:108-437(+)
MRHLSVAESCRTHILAKVLKARIHRRGLSKCERCPTPASVCAQPGCTAQAAELPESAVSKEAAGAQGGTGHTSKERISIVALVLPAGAAPHTAKQTGHFLAMLRSLRLL